VSEWKIGKHGQQWCIFHFDDDGFAWLIADKLELDHAKQLMRHHNVMPKVREALNDCIEALDGAINIPDPSDEDRECFRRVSQKAKAVLAEADT
jgi:hypothetical protein